MAGIPPSVEDGIPPYEFGSVSLPVDAGIGPNELEDIPPFKVAGIPPGVDKGGIPP